LRGNLNRAENRIADWRNVPIPTGGVVEQVLHGDVGDS
jgi:hypothetical protein